MNIGSSSQYIIMWESHIQTEDYSAMVKNDLIVLIKTQVPPSHIVQVQVLFIIESVNSLCKDSADTRKSILKYRTRKQ